MAGSVRAAAGRLLVAQVLLGVGSYAVLLGAGRVLPPSQFAVLALFWSLAFSIGMGVFGPLEILLARAVAEADVGAAANDMGRLVRIYAGVGAVAVTGVVGWLVAGPAVSVPVPFVAAVAVGAYYVVLAVLAAERGVAAGAMDYVLYARLTGVDGLARLLLAALLLGGTLAVVAAPSAIGWILTVVLAGVIAATSCWPRAGTVWRAALAAGQPDNPGRAWGATARDIVAVTGAVTLSVVLANVLPTVVAGLGSSVDELAAFSAAVVVIRIPLFFVGAAQALVLPRATRLAAGSARAFRSWLNRLLTSVVVGSLLMVPLLGVVSGPVVAVAFGSAYVVPSVTTWALAASTAGMVGALTAQSVLIGTGATRQAGLAWLAAGAVFVGGLLLPITEVSTRVAAASALSACVALTLVVVQAWRLHPSPSPTAA